MSDYPTDMNPSDYAALADETHATRPSLPRRSTMDTREIAIGQRVRLYSGRDVGTVEQLRNDGRRVIVRWDTGRTGSWPTYALAVMADEEPDA